MQMTPFFSVVIPTYNRANKLKRTLESVLAQSFIDFEVLVMDDGSTDNTKDMIESFHDPRIIYEWAKNSGGPATPRNRGIDAARSDWICFLDADDIWFPDKLKAVYEVVINNGGVDLVCHDEVKLLEGRELIEKCGPNDANIYQTMLIEGNRVSTSSATVRRDFLNAHKLRFNQSSNYVIVEDFDLWLRIAHCNGRFFFINTSLGKYIIEEDNISSNFTKLHHNFEVLLRDHVYHLQTFQPDKDALWKKIKSGIILARSKQYIINHQYINGAYEFINALKTSIFGTFGYLLLKIVKRLKY
jgi:glycosyltransferase involved in cell wall biosynthesis